MPLVLAHDVGTSGLKTVLVDPLGAILASHTTRYPLASPRPGWFEQEPADYWNGAVANVRSILGRSGVDPSRIAAMAFASQSMGIIPVDAGGEVLHPNIAWVDGRAEAQALAMMKRLGGATVFRWLAGTGITGKDVIPKLRWLRDERSEVYRRTTHFLDVNGYLRFRATGRRVAEWTGACSYGFNLRRKDWERLFFRAAGVDLDKLPPLVRSTDAVGTLTPAAAREFGLPESVVVHGGCDDTQAAAIGAGAVGEGDAHLYLGSSAWAAVTTRRLLRHRHGAVCLQSGDPGMNLVVGITESAGTHLDWFVRHFYPDAPDAASSAGLQALLEREVPRVPPGSDHLILTPWLQGERCPFSSTTERGTLFNVGLEHTRAHVLRALLEGIALNLRWTLDQFRVDFGFAPAVLRVAGGGASNDLWLQGIADITGRPVAAVTEPTLAGALGAAVCAAVGAGFLAGFDALRTLRPGVRRTFQPDPALGSLFAERYAAYRDIHAGLHAAYRRANLRRFGHAP